MKFRQILVALPLLGLSVPALAQGGDPRGWYIGIGGGINYMQDSDAQGRVGPAFFRLDNVNIKRGWVANGYVGYQFGNAKFEIEGAYRDNKIDNALAHSFSQNRVHSGAVMANLIWEFFATSTVTPYIGAGAGAARIWVQHDKDYEFAFQGIAGINVKLTNNVILGIDYRYFRTVDPHLKYSAGSYDFDYVNHTALVTLTYRFSAPPAPIAAPAPAPVPVVQVSRNYMVFFDFDRADITAQADGIIKQAAASAKQGNIQRLNVTGHTDRAGSEQYNMALSLRRANAVKSALVREGIPPDQIAVVGRGESQNLVPTQDGVREAQNRRVEIVLQ